ncbi:zf-HC2 domain-containing protein [Ectothiorhodospiraceae bacterium WFHF3C12]|nr:zf-HC2 domain-containing protein [Ectothiorhodospiraceae bacterium WFHF3C12]
MNAQRIRCEEVIEQLFEFLDQELDEDLSQRIEHHLKHCRDCFTRAEFEKRLRERIDQAAETRAPEALRRRLRRMIEEF